jgi:hypothetical protein
MVKMEMGKDDIGDLFSGYGPGGLFGIRHPVDTSLFLGPLLTHADINYRNFTVTSQNEAPCRK